MISASGGALVVACNKPAKPENKVEPTNTNDPSDPKKPGEGKPGEGKPGEGKPGQPTKPGETKPGEPAKPGEMKPGDGKPPVTPPAKPSTTVNWNSVFRDNVTGEDIQLYPTKEQLEKEEKRLADKVKKILEKNKKDNEKELKDFISKHKKEYEALVKDYKAKIWRDSPTGLDITTHYDKDAVKRADAILDEWTKILLDKIQKANEKTFKDFISKHKKEYEALVKDYKAKIWRDSVTGEDIDLALDTVVIQNNKHYKFFKDSSSSLVADLFDDKIADQVKDAKIRWEKIQKIAKEKAKDKEEAEVLHELVNFSDSLEKELKPLAEKLFQEAKDKEFLTNASNATEDYFKTLDTSKEVNEWKHEKERFNEIITNINKKVEELTGSGNSLESVITDVESNLRNYKDSIKDLKNSKEFWKYEMWNYWLEDLLKTLKRH
ncbi:hypothetical protein D500_00831 [Mycoplasma feriruminatoris]|nr:hypothetical protein D500_00831 [Mycoplasma feriruminatoris]